MYSNFEYFSIIRSTDKCSDGPVSTAQFMPISTIGGCRGVNEAMAPPRGSETMILSLPNDEEF